MLRILTDTSSLGVTWNSNFWLQHRPPLQQLDKAIMIGIVLSGAWVVVLCSSFPFGEARQSSPTAAPAVQAAGVFASGPWGPGQDRRCMQIYVIFAGCLRV